MTTPLHAGPPGWFIGSSQLVAQHVGRGVSAIKRRRVRARYTSAGEACSCRSFLARARRTRAAFFSLRTMTLHSLQ
jgi:hypothetical protein